MMHHKDIKYFQEIIELSGIDTGHVCELGSATMWSSGRDYFQAIGIPRFRKFREYLEHIGFDVVTIDICIEKPSEKLVKLDLSKPIVDGEMLGRFDLLVSFGTIEHIADQYELFRNINNLCTEGATIILAAPNVGSYKGHASWLYSLNFFEKLVWRCGYDPLDIRIMNNRYFQIGKRMGIRTYQVYCSFRKMRENFPHHIDLPVFDERGAAKDKRDYGRFFS